MRLDDRSCLSGWLRLVLFPGLSLAMALAFSAVGAQAQTQTFSAPTTLGPGLNPQVSVDSQRNIDVAWEGVGGGRGVFFGRSIDGGNSFSTTQVQTGFTGIYGLQMAVDSSGNINLLWPADDAMGSVNLWFSRSADGGATFTAPVQIVSKTFGTGPPQIAVDSSGGIDIAWISQDGAVYFFRSTDGGAHFAGPVSVSKPTEGIGGLQMAVRSGGAIYLIWSNAGALFSRSTDNGATFSKPACLSCSTPQGQGDPHMVLDSNGNINVLFGQGVSSVVHFYFTRSQDDGVTFSAPSLIASQPRSSPGAPARLAIEPSGAIDVVWTGDLPGPSLIANSNVMFSRSIDGGGTFSAPKALNFPNVAGREGAYPEQIEIDSQGGIDVLWGDDSVGNSSGANDIFFSRSSDGGATFAKSVNLSNNPGYSGDAHMAIDSSANANVIWVQDINNIVIGSGADSNFQILFSRGSISQQSPGDFTISAAPASLVPLPGGSATTQITMTATGGFNQAINLSCSKLTTGAACSFDPASVTPSASGAHANLTLTIPPTMTQGTFAFTISAASGNATHTQDVQVTVGGLSGSMAPAAMTIAAGSASNFTVTVNSTGGFSGPVSLACGGAPAGVACSFSPSQFNVQANAAATSTLTVQVSTKPSGSLSHRNPPAVFPEAPNFVAISGLLLLMALALVRSANESRAAIARALGAIVLTIALGAAMVSCGGVTSTATSGGTSSPGGTGGGGSAGGAGGGTGGGTSVSFPMTVQAQSGSATANLGTITVTVP
jgi:hypothetical protein